MGTTWLRGATQAVQSDCCECMAVSRTSFRRLTVIVEALAPKSSVASASSTSTTPAAAAAQARPAAAIIASASPIAAYANVLVPVVLCLPPLLSDAFEVAEQLCELFAPVPYIDPLVFALVVNVVEIAQHLDHGEVAPRVVNNTLRAVLDEVLEQLQGLARRPSSISTSAKMRDDYVSRAGTPCRSASIDWLPSL